MDALVTALPDDESPRTLDRSMAAAVAFANPFEEGAPAGPALTAANALMKQLRDGGIVDRSRLEKAGGGKMFGVLVVVDADGRRGYLKAFADDYDGCWELPGFVPPLFDPAQRLRIEAIGAAQLRTVGERRDRAARSPQLAAARLALAALEHRHLTEKEAMRMRHIENRRQRRSLRASNTDPAQLAALARRSCDDKNERRRLEQCLARELETVSAPLRKLERELAALDRLYDYVSRRILREAQSRYRIDNALGERRSLSDLFGTRTAPAGAGDCTATKLLGYAYAHSLRPVALAQFWFGASPPAGGRVSGVFYPACRAKCRPLLPFMLSGLDVASLSPYSPPPTQHLDIRIVYEDEKIVVIDKPPGLLSVPSSNDTITDSATVRLRKHRPGVAGPLFVHRLDMDTSGLLVAALDPASHAMLAKQFAQRTIEKRYVAWVDRELGTDGGTIELAVRSDYNDRPRHIHDPVGGKPAVTHWQVLERRDGRTRVEFHPITGRTHQLRIHAAHPLGLDAPIVGDNLYGRGGERLMLHAQTLRLRHPGTNEFITLESPAPF